MLFFKEHWEDVELSIMLTKPTEIFGKTTESQKIKFDVNENNSKSLENLIKDFENGKDMKICYKKAYGLGQPSKVFEKIYYGVKTKRGKIKVDGEEKYQFFIAGDLFGKYSIERINEFKEI